MGFCNSAKRFCLQLFFSSSLENVVICLTTLLLALPLVKITLLIQNVFFPDLVESIMEACCGKVLFSDELLSEEPCLGKLVGVILLCGPGLQTHKKNDSTSLTTDFLWCRAQAKGLRFPFSHQFEQLF